jgi:hypothetical protein
MSTAAITSTPRMFLRAWIVIVLVGATIIACAVVASLYGNVAPSDLLVGP